MIKEFQHLVSLFSPTFLLPASSDFCDQLPDLDFPVNTLAEGRVLVPWEHQKYPNLTVQYTAG